MPVQRSSGRIRNLSAEDLGIPLPDAGLGQGQDGSRPPDSPVTAPEPLSIDDPLLQTTRTLLGKYGGVILLGPPGTSKTYFAARLAITLAESSSRVRFVQFHPSYQYEDFMEGYVPTEGGFQLRGKHLIEMIEDAEASPQLTFVIVIDELSRGDAARVFGEALTYVEKTKRGLAFSLASGREIAIPPNLVFLATMNPFDRGVDEVDAAFERRFAKIALDPSETILDEMLDLSGMEDPYRTRVLGFFRMVNGKAKDNPYGALGHTYFLGVRDVRDLAQLWEHQLRFLFQKAYQLDPDGRREIERGWQAVIGISGDDSRDDAAGGSEVSSSEVGTDDRDVG